MHYNRHYAGDPDADVNAIRDIQDYLDEKQWNLIVEAALARKESCRTLEGCLCMTGVQGFPIFAFLRAFRPEQYQEWYDNLPGGDDAE